MNKPVSEIWSETRRIFGGGSKFTLVNEVLRSNAQRRIRRNFGYGKPLHFAFLATFWLVGVRAEAVSGGAPQISSDLHSSGAAAATGPVFLVVDKSALRATLYNWQSGAETPQALWNVRIAIGKEEGDKQKEGDNRTPEGIYFTQEVIDDANLPPKYGAKAITLDFPNPMDQVDGKTGHGIWLHGVENSQRIDAAKITEGCVAFLNSDITKLVDWLRPGQGVVVITDNANLVNEPGTVKSLRDRTLSWAETWGKRDLGSYINYYAAGFRQAGKDLAAFRTYKERVFAQYRSMRVGVEKLAAFTHPKYAISVVEQRFTGDNVFQAHGRKILYWHRQTTGQWQIMREVFHEGGKVDYLTVGEGELATLRNSTELSRN